MSLSPPMSGANAIARSPLSERRRHTRAVLPGKASIPLTLNRKEVGAVLDVSESGIGFSSRGRLRTGSTTSLWFELPGSKKRVEASGVIAWTTSSGRAGIRFLHLSNTAQGLLEGWLSRTEEEKVLRMRVEARANDPEVKAAELAISSRQLEIEDALSLIAERARMLTRAVGAAIALAGAKGFVCRATAGNAPDLGVSLRPDSGLSGECIRSGKIVRCDDTEDDPRADKVACRTLDLRSTVIVPVIGENERVTGLLEVHSSSARNFAGRDVLLLRQFAALVNGVVVAADNPSPQTKALAASAGAQLRMVSVAPSVSPPEGEEAKEDQNKVLVSPDGANLCDVCGYENLPSARSCEKCDVPLPSSLEPDAEALKVPAPAPAAMDEFARLEKLRSVGKRTRVPRGTMLFFAGALLLLSAAAYGAWRYSQEKEKAVSAISTPAASPASATKSPFANTPAEIVPPTGRRDAAGKLVHSSTRDTKLGVSSKSGKVTKLAPRSKTGPIAEDADLRPLAAAEPPVAAPMVNVPDPPALATPVSLPSQPALRVSRGVENPVLVKKIKPTYPINAKQRHVQGVVVLQGNINRNGRLEAVQVESGDRLLAEAAIQAVRQWVYNPARLDGQPVEVPTRIVINFALP